MVMVVSRCFRGACSFAQLFSVARKAALQMCLKASSCARIERQSYIA